MNRLAELLRELKNHVGETYSTLDKGSTGKNIRHDANALAKTLKSSFPMLEKDPQYVGAEDLINSGFGVMPLSTKLPATAFSEAHDLAQKNAALPIEQGGLGLHPDNTAMDRARALGFDVKASHKTDADIEKFQNKYLGKNTIGHATDKAWENTSKLGHWFSEEGIPDKMPGNINYPVMLRMDDPSEFSSLYQLVGNLEEKGIKKLKRDAEISGNDSYLINKDHETGLQSYVIPNPKNIRSRFAAFDPMKKNSANILASLLLGLGLAKDEK